MTRAERLSLIAFRNVQERRKKERENNDNVSRNFKNKLNIKKMDKIRIFTEYNALTDKEQAKKGTKAYIEEYAELSKMIEKPLSDFNKENPDLDIVYLFDPNTNEFSVFRSDLTDEKSKEKCVEFLVYLNRLSNGFFQSK